MRVYAALSIVPESDQQLNLDQGEVWLSLLKQQDAQAFKHLYKHYAPALYGAICRNEKNEILAVKILEQSFTRIWHELPNYNQNKCSLFIWMSRICRHCAPLNKA